MKRLAFIFALLVALSLACSTGTPQTIVVTSPPVVVTRVVQPTSVPPTVAPRVAGGFGMSVDQIKALYPGAMWQFKQPTNGGNDFWSTYDGDGAYIFIFVAGNKVVAFGLRGDVEFANSGVTTGRNLATFCRAIPNGDAAGNWLVEAGKLLAAERGTKSETVQNGYYLAVQIDYSKGSIVMYVAPNGGNSA